MSDFPVFGIDWFAAEARQHGKPILIRGKRIPASKVPDPLLPFLFVLAHRYVIADEIGLPLPEQYSSIGKFEQNVLDALEKDRIGMLVFAETGKGVVRYYCYVRDIEIAAAFVNEQTPPHFVLDLSSANDNEWAEYRRLIKQIKGQT